MQVLISSTYATKRRGSWLTVNTPEVVIIQISKQTNNNKEEDEGAQISFKQLSRNKPPPCFFPSLKTPLLWIGSEITEKKKNDNFQLPNSDTHVSSAHFPTKLDRAFRPQNKDQWPNEPQLSHAQLFTCRVLTMQHGLKSLAPAGIR